MKAGNMENSEAPLETGTEAVAAATNEIRANAESISQTPEADGSAAPANDEPDVAARIDAARERAAQFVADRRFSEARQALEEADALESPTSVPEVTSDTLRARGTRLLSAVRDRSAPPPSIRPRVQPNRKLLCLKSLWTRWKSRSRS